jgi:hypothetical protein
MTTVYFGLDGGHGTVTEAEHWLGELVAGSIPSVDGLVACTHLTREPWPHVAVSLAVLDALVPTGLPPVPPPLVRAAARARAEHATRRAGRAVVYPGRDRLTGLMSVAEIVDTSAIERVVALGVPAPSPGTVVETRDFVRPQWMHGQLTLVTTAAAHGRIAPFEVPNPTPCCANHG